MIASIGFCIWVIANQYAFNRSVEDFGIVLVLYEDKDTATYFTHVGVVWFASMVFLPGCNASW